MGFASAYLSGNTIFPEIIKEAPDSETGLIIVVPAYKEPEVTTLLDSLAACRAPDCRAEVIIVVNAPVSAAAADSEINRKTVKDISIWKKAHPGCFFNLFTIDSALLKPIDWCVGIARKAGMDEAIRRFDLIGNREGAVICLDADCTVESNYFSVICGQFYKRKERSGCSIYFEHPLKGDEFPVDHYIAIALYELHLRYFFQGLNFTGFPYVHHTVGSSIAVKALPYIRAGGMNRRIAGEDFYFVQKLVQGGGYVNLTGTTIYPAPRSSVRVPFGTAATVKRLTDRTDETYRSYNVSAFRDLKTLFSLLFQGILFNSGDQEAVYFNLPESVRLFLGMEEWMHKITEIRENTSGEKTFIKRFFGWFNMFKIVKYMNMIHRTYYEKKPVTESASELLKILGYDLTLKDPSGLLEQYRHLEKAF